MRSCLLRAGLLRAAGSGQFVLGNPKAWLGNAYHAVLERVPEIETGAACEPSIDSLWNEAIELQYQRAATHPLDRRFGEPRTWPGYHLARASVLLRARFLLERRDAVHPECPGRFDETDEALSEIREKEFAAFDGKLVGRPDVIRDGEITDYKSGAIVELDEHGEHEVVKAAYIGQIRIYAYLVKKTLGWWPRRGLLLPLLGPGVEIAVDPATCETEAKAAVSLLDTYNRKIAAQSDVAILASPALGSCKWCPFKLVCPPFWTSVSPEWSGRLDGTVVEGTVTEAPRIVHSGAATIVSIDVQRGSVTPGRFEIGPLQVSTHPAVSAIGAGDAVRIVGLWLRPDGSLAPTQRTVVARADDLPRIVVAES